MIEKMNLKILMATCFTASLFGCVEEDKDNNGIVIDTNNGIIINNGEEPDFSNEFKFKVSVGIEERGLNFELPTLDSDVNYEFDVDCDSDGEAEETRNKGAYVCEYEEAGEYSITLSGKFPSLLFSKSADKESLIEVQSWGTTKWNNLERAFQDCTNLTTVPTEEAPDLSALTSLKLMFSGATSFNSNINHWDVSNVTNLRGLFYKAELFNQPLNDWKVDNVTNFVGTFEQAGAFDQPLDKWQVSKAETMAVMFKRALAFNQPLDSWDVSNVQEMNGMFDGGILAGQLSPSPLFNQPLNSWDVSKVTTMEAMFANSTSFNQPLDTWNVSQVTNMANMFGYTSKFNHPLDSWDVSSLTSMAQIFRGATDFNQPLASWDISKVTTLNFAFDAAANFNQDLSAWNPEAATDMDSILVGTSFSTENYDKLLVAWSTKILQNDVPFGVEDTTFSASSASAKAVLVDTFKWTIIDGGQTP